MLNRLPKHAGELNDLLADIGNPKSKAIAKALGVSVRTVERWKKTGAPRTALLSLWWLSREGHSVWDCEMAAKTQLALSLHKTLWQSNLALRREIEVLKARMTDGSLRPQDSRRMFRRAANE